MQSPGHQQHPEHHVKERRVSNPMRVEYSGVVIASSSDVICVEEDRHRDRYYFPRSSVSMELLTRSDTTTKCPFKGTANYYSVKVEGKTLEDAVWTYEDPYDEHVNLKERLSFYDDKFPELRVVGA